MGAIRLYNFSVNAAAGALLLGASLKAFSHVADFELKNGTVRLV